MFVNACRKRRAELPSIYMKMSWKQLHNLPVITQSGQKIGLVEGVTLDINTHGVFQYQVKPGRVVLAMFSKELLVSPVDVISMDEKAMIVKDSVLSAQPVTNNKKTRLTLRPEGIEMSELQD